MAGVGDSYLLLQKDQIINASSIVEFHDFAEGTLTDSTTIMTIWNMSLFCFCLWLRDLCFIIMEKVLKNQN